MKHPAPTTSCSAAAHDLRAPGTGFTLLELMLAVAVFTIVSVAVLGVFRTGTQAYQATSRETVLLQRARYVFDTLETDLMNVFYRDETSYNVEARRRLEEFQQQRLEAEETGDWDEFERMYGEPEREEQIDDPNYVGNPFEKGRIIDLAMVGNDGGELDELSFAIKQPAVVGRDYYFWGLSRVHYTVDGEFLIRSEETIEVDPQTIYGDPLEKDSRPAHTIVAEGIRRFDLSYAFWWDNQWYEIERWNSSNRQIRNPSHLKGIYDEETRGTFGNTYELGSEEYNEELNDQDGQPLDRVPTYVRVELELAHPDNPARTQTLQRIFRVPFSQETWEENINLEEEDRELEQQLRDDEYVPVFPGAMKKR